MALSGRTFGANRPNPGDLKNAAHIKIDTFKRVSASFSRERRGLALTHAQCRNSQNRAAVITDKVLNTFGLGGLSCVTEQILTYLS